MTINRQPLTKKFWQSGPIAAFSMSAQPGQLLYLRRLSTNWISTLLMVLIFWVKPSLGLANMCITFPPDELIREMNLIFKGKVIDSKRFFLDKFDVTDVYKKIWSRNDINIWSKGQELLKAIKPYVDAKHFNELVLSQFNTVG